MQYLAQYPNVLPIWGVQRETEMDEFLSYVENPPVYTKEIEAFIEKEKSSCQVISAEAVDIVCHVQQELRLTIAHVCHL